MIKNSPFTKIEINAFLIALIAHLLAAYYSFGFHHLDEHYQIWEWANYFLKLSPDPSKLPWEFGAQIRPWFQPFLHAFGMKLALILGIFNPFSFAFFARALYAIVNLWSLGYFWRTWRDREKLNPLWLLLILTLWFFPYLHVRTSSENLASIFLTFAFGYFLKPSDTSHNNENKKYFWTGILFGFSLGLFGLGVFLLWRDRKVLKIHWFMVLGFVMPIFLGFLLDRIGYGNWVNAPYRYFSVNLIQGVAAGFNPYPWYQYFIWILELNPFVSLPLFFGFILYLYKKRFDVISSFMFSFFIIHCFIINKEYRFLFPILNLIPFLAASGIQAIYPNFIEGIKKKSFYIPYAFMTILAFTASSMRGASINTLWLVDTVHHHYIEGQMILVNRDYVENPQTSYYTLPPHPHHIVHSGAELEMELKSYPDAKVIIDGNLQDQVTQDLWNVPKRHSCRLASSAYPYFIYSLKDQFSFVQRMRLFVLYECGQRP